MKLVVGLGNPGLKYENTRHNAGFMVIDKLAEKLGAKVNKIKFKGLYDKLTYKGESIVFLKPQTFMNESGLSVMEAWKFFKLEVKDIIIIYDDIDIPFASIRVKSKGSSGSHNGMKSVIYHLQDDKFPRIRVSIGKRPDYMDLADFVLSNFTKEEEKILDKEIDAACDAVITWLEQGIDTTMNRFNGMDLG